MRVSEQRVDKIKVKTERNPVRQWFCGWCEIPGTEPGGLEQPIGCRAGLNVTSKGDSRKG